MGRLEVAGFQACRVQGATKSFTSEKTMLSQMKTGTKILCAFGLALVVTLVVGYIGYRGIAKIGENAVEHRRESSTEHRAIESVSRRGQLSAAYALRGMINRRMMRKANAVQSSSPTMTAA